MSTPNAPTAANPTSEVDASETAPACLMSFNAADPSGAGGTAADVGAAAAMGTHCLPVVTVLLMRDSAEVFDQDPVDESTITEQAEGVLEDMEVNAFKVGYLGSVEGMASVAELLSDYADTPVVTYCPALPWIDDSQQEDYWDALKDLILPQTTLLVGNHVTLRHWLMPDWDKARVPSAREFAAAAAEHGVGHVLVTGIPVTDGDMVENLLASAEGAAASARFERFEATFIGAGDSLSAAIAALLANGADLGEAVSEALAFLDSALDAGFRPGMGNVLPDRFFWAHADGATGASESTDTDEPSPATGDAEPGSIVYRH